MVRDRECRRHNSVVQDLGSAGALLLAAVFAWAGAAKAVAPQRTTTAFRSLGLPGAGGLARVVPALELITAAALIVSPRLGAAAALALLGAFTVFVVSALAGGRTVGCGCFGAARPDDQLSWLEPARNLLLAALAVTALFADQLTAPSAPALVAVGSAAMAAALGLGLARLRQRVGAVWTTPLPGTLPTR
jgi:hypothetical protein